MTVINDRLTASKVKYDEQQVDAGHKAGREWAEKQAEWEDLVSLRDFFEATETDISLTLNAESVDEHFGGDFFSDWLLGQQRKLSDEFAANFVSGAIEYMEEQESQQS